MKYEGTEGVRSVVAETKLALQLNCGNLVKAIGFYFILSLVVDFVILYVVEPDIEALAPNSVGGIGLADIVSFCLWVLIAVRTHRVLINQAYISSPLIASMNSTGSFIRFTLRTIWLLMLAIISLLPLVMVFLINFNGLPESITVLVLSFFAVIISFILMWYLSRLCLVLPSVAVQIPMTFSEALRYTEHHQFLLFFTVILTPLFVGFFPFFLLANIINSLLIYSVVISIVSNVFLILEVALLSVTFLYVFKIVDRNNDVQLKV